MSWYTLLSNGKVTRLNSETNTRFDKDGFDFYGKNKYGEKKIKVLADKTFTKWARDKNDLNNKKSQSTYSLSKSKPDPSYSKKNNEKLKSKLAQIRNLSVSNSSTIEGFTLGPGEIQCPKCNGTGKSMDWDGSYKSNMRQGKKMNPCTMCLGAGKIKKI